MVSIKTIASGLSAQIEAAIAGKADPVQAKVLCDSVASVINLARLQIEMADFDWETSPEKPVIEMEKSNLSISAPSNEAGKMDTTGTAMLSLEVVGEMDDDALGRHIVAMEKELSHVEKEATDAADSNGVAFKNLDRKCKQLRKYLRDLRDEKESR